MDCLRCFKGSLPTRFFVFGIFAVSSIVVCLAHLILLVFVKPISKRIYFLIVQYVNWTFIAQSVYFYEFWSDSDVIFYCKRSDYEALRHEKVFVIANHSHDIDIVLWMVIMNHFQKLGNDICYAKDLIKFIPFIGWHVYLSQHIRLKICYEEDKKTIERRLQEIGANPNAVWVVFMPEGPHFTKQRHDESIKFALNKEIQSFSWHLIPRVKGFVATYEALRQQGYTTILNAQVAFDVKDFAQPKYSSLMGCRRMKAHVFLERLPMEKVQPNFDGIYDIFKRKDELHGNFMKHGKFNKNGNSDDIISIPMQKHKSVLVNFICWCIVLMSIGFIGGYAVIVHLYYKDMENYSNIGILIRMACDTFDISYAYLRAFLY